MNMVGKCIVHMHMTAELKAYWFLVINFLLLFSPFGQIRNRKAVSLCRRFFKCKFSHNIFFPRRIEISLSKRCILRPHIGSCVFTSQFVEMYCTWGVGI